MLPDKSTLKKIWAEVPPDYYYQLNWLQRQWHNRKWKIIHSLVTQNLFNPKTILEIGCSSGHLSQLLSETFPQAKVTGVDVYKPAIIEAKKRHPHLTFKVADAHNLPFPDKSFDLVVCSETIEHVVDPGKVIHEMTRVLTPNGRALIEMDSGSPLFRLVWFFWVTWGKGKVWKHAHLHPFTAKKLEKEIAGNGFVVREKKFSHLGMAVSFLVTRSD